MTNRLDPYDVLGIVVPGALLVGWTGVCFPDLAKGLSQVHFPPAFAVIVLTAVAVFAGHLIQALASLVEPVIFRTWGGRPSDRALLGEIRGLLPADSAERIKAKLLDAVDGAGETHSLFLYAMQLADGQNQGRGSLFNALYAYHRALLVLLLLCVLMLGASMKWGAAGQWPAVQSVVLIAVAFLLVWLFWHRSWQRASYYVREVLLTAERILDDRKRGKE